LGKSEVFAANLAYIEARFNEYNLVVGHPVDASTWIFSDAPRARDAMSKSKSVGSGRVPAPPTPQPSQPSRIHAARETVESVAMAVILAFLFRAFVAEAFVIPTGSMAPTLMGQHKDITCPECGYEYQAGASIEIDNRTANTQRRLEQIEFGSSSAVVATTCPICRYRKILDLYGDANERTFAGDRILVSKFAYEFADPDRWDVIVFKYPFNAKQNFIKRLVGRPNETIRIYHGDIFVKQEGEQEFRIARKRDSKLLTMLQLVDDTDHIAKDLIDVGWPQRWQPWTDGSHDISDVWKTDDHGHSYTTKGDVDQDTWLRYHHVIPSLEDWNQISGTKTLPDMTRRNGQLITDFYAYNAFTSVEQFYLDPDDFDPTQAPEEYANPLFGSRSLHPYGTLGMHWVGDLAFEGEVTVEGQQGELLLRLVKGGISYICRIDAGSGAATLSIGGEQHPFVGADGQEAVQSVGQTPVRGPGRYQIRFSNVDCELRLWVNNDRIKFDGPTTYKPRDRDRPVSSADDPGDLAPLGVGSCGLALKVQALKVYRDIYYVATQTDPTHEYRVTFGGQRIQEILSSPELWATTPLFNMRGEVIKTMGPDQYFPLGDNSPQSSDARLWPESFVDRDLLIGKAILIYWPHTWNRPIPFLPNFKRMRLIR
jgi:signal peptidase I